MLLGAGIFLGLQPKTDPTLLDSRASTIARDCDIVSGKLIPIQTTLPLVTLASSDRRSLYPYADNYLTWTGDVDVQRSPIAEDRYNRIYYTGDGVPKVRGINPTTLAQEEYTLGVEKPAAAPTITVQAKSTVDWTREWHCGYEEADGTILDVVDLEEGTDAGEVRVISAGKSFLLLTRPARVTASASSVFVLYFEGYAANGSPLGRIYPNISASRANSDLEVAGAKITAAQVNNAVTTTFVLTYDSSRVADYTVYRSYVYTFLSAWGEESAPSDPTDTVSVDPSQDCLVNGFSQPVGVGNNITAIRIYRTVTGNSGTAFQFVAELTLPTVSYLDELTDAETAEVLPSTGWTFPPSDLAGLVAHPGGFFAAFRTGAPKTLYFSYPNQPHAWPTAYSITVDYDIVGLAVVGNGIVVMTKGKPQLVYGDHPDSLAVTTIPLSQACVSKRGIVVEQTVVIYPSPDGLVVIEGGQGRIITGDYFSKDEGSPAWKDINPSTMVAGVHDRRYHGWTSSHSIIFGLYEGPSALTTTSEPAQGVYSHLENDDLLLIQGFNIVKWRGGTGRKTLVRRGPRHQLSRHWSPSCARVTASGYPVTLKLYSGQTDTLVMTRTITSDIATRIPILRDEKFWSIEVESQYTVNEVIVSNSMAELEQRKK